MGEGVEVVGVWWGGMRVRVGAAGRGMWDKGEKKGGSRRAG